MRIAGLVVLVVGCGGHGTPLADAPPDVATTSCTAASGTAAIQVAGASLQRFDAGEIVGGLVTGVDGAPVSLIFVFTNAERISPCCGSVPTDTTCCNVDVITARIDALAGPDVIGTHDVTFYRSIDPSIAAAGTLTISQYVDPLMAPPAPGRIAGSVTGPQLSGTFDNGFCSDMLGETI